MPGTVSEIVVWPHHTCSHALTHKEIAFYACVNISKLGTRKLDPSILIKDASRLYCDKV